MATPAEEQKMPPPMAGITHHILNALNADPRVNRSMTTEQLCHEVIMQETTARGWTLRSDKTPEGWTLHTYINAPQQIEFVRLPGMHPPEGCISYCELTAQTICPSVSIGHSNRFISHAWRLKFVELVEAVSSGLFAEGSLVRNLETSELGTIVSCQEAGSHQDNGSAFTVNSRDGALQSLSASLLEPMHDDVTPIYLWLDVVAINQHEPEKVSKGFSSTFMEAVGKIGHTLMVIETFHIPSAVVFSRSWCIWELYCTSRTGAALTFCLPATQRRELVEYLQSHTMVWSIAGVESAHAEAGAEKDRAKIADAIAASIGHRTLDEMANKLRMEWSFTVLQTAVEDMREEGQLSSNAATAGAMGVAGLLASTNQHAAAGDLFNEVAASWERLATSETDEDSQRSLRVHSKIARLHFARTLERQGLYSASLSQWEMLLTEPGKLWAEQSIDWKESYGRCLALNGNLQMSQTIYEEILRCNECCDDNSCNRHAKSGVQLRYARILRKQGEYSRSLDELSAIEERLHEHYTCIEEKLQEKLHQCAASKDALLELLGQVCQV